MRTCVRLVPAKECHPGGSRGGDREYEIYPRPFAEAWFPRLRGDDRPDLPMAYDMSDSLSAKACLVRSSPL